VKIGYEAGLGWLPSEQLSGDGVGGRCIDLEQLPQKAEVVGRVLKGDAHGRQSEVLADRGGDRLGRFCLVADRVKPGTGGRLVEGQSEQTCSVFRVRRGPSVRAVADVGGDPGWRAVAIRTVAKPCRSSSGLCVSGDSRTTLERTPWSAGATS
jgi:hypothetical protein